MFIVYMIVSLISLTWCFFKIEKIQKSEKVISDFAAYAYIFWLIASITILALAIHSI